MLLSMYFRPLPFQLKISISIQKRLTITNNLSCQCSQQAIVLHFSLGCIVISQHFSFLVHTRCCCRSLFLLLLLRLIRLLLIIWIACCRLLLINIIIRVRTFEINTAHRTFFKHCSIYTTLLLTISFVMYFFCNYQD